jgi:YHS domain-containing protein
MFRAIAYLIATVLIISVLRAVIGVILKGFNDLFRASDPQPKRPTVPAGGELKKDPVCGTFISAATSIQKTVGQQTYYFCSVECRNRFGG